MSTTKTERRQNAIGLLRDDHQKVKALFDQFEDTEDRKDKKKIVAQALHELKIHATVEEQLFYPALRQEIQDEEGLMEEADEEHHVAKVLIAELDQMTGQEDNYDAKFMVLAENVRHHIKEEEGEIFPEAKKSDIDLDELGLRMAALKQELMRKGIPRDAEAEMVERSGVRTDSPAKQAQRNIEVPKK